MFFFFLQSVLLNAFWSLYKGLSFAWSCVGLQSTCSAWYVYVGLLLFLLSGFCCGRCCVWLSSYVEFTEVTGNHFIYAPLLLHFRERNCEKELEWLSKRSSDDANVLVKYVQTMSGVLLSIKSLLKNFTHLLWYLSTPEFREQKPIALHTLACWK
jgi:hypothetical protein